MTEARVIADSKNEFGQRITTFIITFPRYLLAEFNTHRMLSRNSASSRAIRFEKMLQSVRENPFIPMKWQKDHPGMQGTEYFEEEESETASNLWLNARDLAINSAKELHSYGITKQLCNRILEPFMYHTCLCTGTEWENFFALRAHEMAEIHFQDLAEKMLVAINNSEPNQLKAGEWHIPFGDKFSGDELYAFLETLGWNYKPDSDSNAQYQYRRSVYEMLKVKLATVRCARISYNTQDNDSTIAKDLELHDRLSLSGHFSAFEHTARAMNEKEYEEHSYTYVNHQTGQMDTTFGVCGNYTGFIQYRKMLPNENRIDSRLLKK